MPAGISHQKFETSLRNLRDELGHVPSTNDYTQWGDHSIQVAYKFYDSWGEALESIFDDYSDDGYVDHNKRAMICPKCDEEFRSAGEQKTVRCRNCEENVNRQRAVMAYQAQLDDLQRLVEGPAPGTEIAPMCEQTRWMAEKVKIQGSGSRTVTIYYLPGDERRAVDLILEEEPEWVGEQIENPHAQLLKTSLSDLMYELLVQQYYWKQMQEDDDV